MTQFIVAPLQRAQSRLVTFLQSCTQQHMPFSASRRKAPVLPFWPELALRECDMLWLVFRLQTFEATTPQKAQKPTTISALNDAFLLWNQIDKRPASE